MKISRFRLLSSNGKDTIVGTRWTPRGKVKGVVQLVHGMQEHMGCYDRFARYLCECGFAVVGTDFIGHGASAAEGKLGHFTDSDSSEFLVMDMRKVTELARNKYRKKKLFIYSHSFGSFVTRLYISRYRDVDGAILAGTGDWSAVLAGNVLKMLHTKIAQKGGEIRSEVIQNLIFGGVVRKFLPMKNNYEWVTRDTEKIREYLEDTKYNYIFTLNGFYTLLSTVMKCDSDSVYENVPADLPILVLAGSDDAVGDYVKGTKSVYEKYRKSGHTKTELKIYDGARHNLLHETNFLQVQKFLVDWIERNANKQ